MDQEADLRVGALVRAPEPALLGCLGSASEARSLRRARIRRWSWECQRCRGSCSSSYVRWHIRCGPPGMGACRLWAARLPIPTPVTRGPRARRVPGSESAVISRTWTIGPGPDAATGAAPERAGCSRTDCTSDAEVASAGPRYGLRPHLEVRVVALETRRGRRRHRSRGSAAPRRCAASASTGRLVLVGDEPHRPYDRPPLSKELLRGEREPEQIALDEARGLRRAAARAAPRRARAGARPRRAARVVLENGERLAYDGLVIATGRARAHAARRAAARGHPRAAHARRRARDPRRARAQPARRRGRRGLHRRRGRGDLSPARARRDAARGAAAPDGARAEPRGRRASARPRTATPASTCGSASASQAIEGGARVERVRARTTAARVAADLVVVGIGAIPETRWLESSGLALARRRRSATRACATQRPASSRPATSRAGSTPGYGESDPHRALDQRRRAGRRGGRAPARRPAARRPFAPVPFVWSDQYDLKIQATGRIRPDDEMFVGARLARRAPLRRALRPQRTPARRARDEPRAPADGLPPHAARGRDRSRRRSRARAPRAEASQAEACDRQVQRLVVRRFAERAHRSTDSVVPGSKIAIGFVTKW